MTDHLKTVMAACWEFRCCFCARPLPRLWHVEHLIPKCRGGTDALENLAVACQGCNLRKGDRTAVEFQRHTRVPTRAARVATLLLDYTGGGRVARIVVRRIVADVRTRRASRGEGVSTRG